MTVTAPPPVEIEELEEIVERATTRWSNGHDQAGHTRQGTGSGGSSPESEPYRPPAKPRRSIWPFLLDLGLAMMLFGWIIIGQFLVVIGAVIFVVALTGWIRDARADFSNLRD
jgi:hypothetical protein